jgi:hypothetical protein
VAPGETTGTALRFQKAFASDPMNTSVGFAGAMSLLQHGSFRSATQAPVFDNQG